MNYIERLLSMDGSDWVLIIIAFFLILFAAVEIIKAAAYMRDYTGYESKEEKRFRVDEEAIKELQKEVQVINRTEEKMADSIDSVNSQLQEITQRLDESTVKNQKRVRAELKDRIGQSYRYYHERQCWNSMEKEALEDLIQEYEDAGGSNSFVHSKVQKEMYTWKEVPMDYKGGEDCK